MKALRCEQCHDLVVPFEAEIIARFCMCGRHAIWHLDTKRDGGKRRKVAVHDTQGANDQATIVRISNDLIRHPGETNGFDIAGFKALNQHRDFAVQDSLIVKAAINQAPDSSWSDTVPSSDRIMKTLIVRTGPGPQTQK